MAETVVDRVLAAKAAVEAKYAVQISNGVSLSEPQQAEIFVAQVQAILSQEVLTPSEETTS